MAASQCRSLQLTQLCREMPMKELYRSTRNCLATYLNPPVQSVNKDSIQQDWSGLAELMELTNQTIKNLEQNNSPTIALLEAFEEKRGATVGRLWDFLIELERYDIVEDKELVKKFDGDVAKWKRRKEESPPIQVDEVSAGSVNSGPYGCYSRNLTTDGQNDSMVIDDVLTGQLTIFDAFVSACEEDFCYVKELMQILEDKHKLKLFIDGRDLLPGSSVHTVTADIIAKRCRKILLLMTPNYLKSEQYDFQSKIALSLSHGGSQRFIIPVLLRRLDEIPLVIKHIHPVDNTRDDMSQWFWGKLLAAIRNQAFTPLDYEQRKLRELCIKLREPGSFKMKRHERPDKRAVTSNDASAVTTIPCQSGSTQPDRDVYVGCPDQTSQKVLCSPQLLPDWSPIRSDAVPSDNTGQSSSEVAAHGSPPETSVQQYHTSDFTFDNVHMQQSNHNNVPMHEACPGDIREQPVHYNALSSAEVHVEIMKQD